MTKGLFITFEGPDGCGKTTQIEFLKNYLCSKGYEVILTREPGGTAMSEKIRSLILDPENKEESGVTEALLFAASRAQHVAEKIKPAIAEGKIVLCDRFMDSSIAYQAYARGLGDDVVSINLFAIQGCFPDLTIFLDLDPLIGQKRQIERGKLDRLEQEGLAFQQKVYEGYQELIKKYPERIKVVNADRDPESIEKDIECLIQSLLEQ